jgi:hypothetical protein
MNMSNLSANDRAKRDAEASVLANIGKPRSLHAIAREIRQTWPKVNYAAVPYLDAMGSLDSISDSYGCDDAKSIVLYFLSNAATWRGPDAKRIKAELKGVLK